MSFLRRAASKVRSNKGEQGGARAEQKSRLSRDSRPSHVSTTLNQSRAFQEGDDVLNRIGEHAGRKRSRPSSTSSMDAWVMSATGGELLEKSPPELARAILNLRTQNELLKASKEQREMRNRSGGKDDDTATFIQRCEQLEKNLAYMQKELKEEKEKSADIERAKKKVVKSLMTMTKSDPYFLDDRHFRISIQTLRYSVAHWVRNQSWRLAGHRSIRSPTGLDRYGFLKSVSDNYKDYASSGKGLESIIQAHIWRFFLQDIFGQDAWGEIEVQGAKEMLTCWKLKKHFEETVSDKHIEVRHEWRVANARLMKARQSKLVKQGLDSAIYDLSFDMEGQLKVIAHKLDSQGLKNLIREALELDASMQQQRVSYVFYPDISCPPEAAKLMFSESTMDIAGYDGEEPLTINQQVKLVLAPGLWRYGTSAGKEYSKGSCMLPAEVDIIGDVKN